MWSLVSARSPTQGLCIVNRDSGAWINPTRRIKQRLSHGGRGDCNLMVLRRKQKLCTSRTDSTVESDVRAGVPAIIGNGIAQSSQEEENDRIKAFLSGKHILITGGTGFIGKVLIEKILHSCPNVGQIYLIIQGKSGISPRERMHKEIIASGVFERIKDMCRKGQLHSTADFEGDAEDVYQQYMGSKLTAISGNLGEENLGMAASEKSLLKEKINIIINSAATTTFDERYDIAVRLNTLGAKRVLDLARECSNIQAFVHVSTAYVNGRRVGITPEVPFEMNAAIADEANARDFFHFDLKEESERMSVEREVELAQSLELSLSKKVTVIQECSEEYISSIGMTRASKFGWQDTYVFTKAMGEMLLVRDRGHIPLVVVRPSIVESSHREPFPGWIEGIRMCDPIFLAIGKGQTIGFAADPNGVIDVIPVDKVVNVVLASAAAHANTDRVSVYQVATSSSNPMLYSTLARHVASHFGKYPMKNKDGSKINVKTVVLFPSVVLFNIYSTIRYKLPFVVANFMARLRNDKSTLRKATILEKSFDLLTHYSRIYSSYSFYKGRFDATNVQKLYRSLNEHEKQRYDFNLESVEWSSYVCAHISGLKKYVIKIKAQ